MDSTTPSTPKKAGRPPKAGGPITPAARQRAYRERLAQGERQATEDLSAAPTKALLANLAHQIVQIENNRSLHIRDDLIVQTADTGRHFAAKVINELCHRYKIQLT